MGSVTPAEQSLVRWMAGVHENNYVAGIQAMNDVAQMYPHDKRLNFLIGYWLYKLDEYERSKTFTLKALADDSSMRRPTTRWDTCIRAAVNMTKPYSPWRSM